jgi:tRNA U34 2-thiouridine synthase MnmA/TrmU
MKQVKCILLYSGGLDSLVAGKILMNQGIDVIGLHFILPYFPPDLNPEELKESIIAKQIDLKLTHYWCGQEYIDMLKHPPHGYGKNINPCVDCKIFFINKAFELMKETGADFVATGEVVGQRPMSQLKHTLNHIENTTIKGMLLRPLSAKLLKPTIAEINGMVDREKLYDISGRGRSRQIELAVKFGIKDYSSPAGGCLFTDKFMAQRVRDLIEYFPDFKQQELYLLKAGRHFRLNSFVKIIVTRNERENIELEKYESMFDYSFKPLFKGPSVFVKGTLTEDHKNTINSIICRYGKPSEEENIIEIYKQKILYDKSNSLEPISDDILEKMRI